MATTALSGVSGTDYQWDWECGRPHSVKLEVAAKTLRIYQIFKAQMTINASFFSSKLLGLTHYSYMIPVYLPILFLWSCAKKRPSRCVYILYAVGDVTDVATM